MHLIHELSFGIYLLGLLLGVGGKRGGGERDRNKEGEMEGK
jgi:hypothetical protein